MTTQTTDIRSHIDALIQHIEQAIDIGIKQLKLDVITIEQHGDTAIEMSHYTMLGESDHVIDHGKGIVIWKHEQGSWKLFRDIWTTSLPHFPSN